MYDLPDSTLGSLRSLRPGLFCCLLLLVSGLMAGVFIELRGEQIQADLRDAAHAQVDAVFDGSVSTAREAGDAAFTMISALPGRAVTLATIGMVMSIFLLMLGFRGRVAMCWSMTLGAATIASGVFQAVIAMAVPVAGVEAAAADWAPFAGVAVGLVVLMHLIGLVVAGWNLLVAPAPGRDDLSTFVEL